LWSSGELPRYGLLNAIACRVATHLNIINRVESYLASPIALGVIAARVGFWFTWTGRFVRGRRQGWRINREQKAALAGRQDADDTPPNQVFDSGQSAGTVVG
jgi:hypothetical protein